MRLQQHGRDCNWETMRGDGCQIFFINTGNLDFPLADMCEHCQTLCPCSEVDIGKETKIFFLKVLKKEKHSCSVERRGLESHSGPVADDCPKEQVTFTTYTLFTKQNKLSSGRKALYYFVIQEPFGFLSKIVTSYSLELKYKYAPKAI